MIDAYLLIDGVPGECLAAGFKDHIEVLSYNHGVSQSASLSASTAGGATTGRCDHQDFSIIKQLDKASPLLVGKCSDGSHIATVTLTLVSSAGGGDKKVPYMEYKLHKCIISSVSTSGGGGEFPTESVTFNYGKIEWTYTQQKRDDGSGGGKVAGCWNLQTNTSK